MSPSTIERLRLQQISQLPPPPCLQATQIFHCVFEREHACWSAWMFFLRAHYTHYQGHATAAAAVVTGRLATCTLSVHRLTDQESVRPSEVVQSFHLHNNEVGSEVFDCVCLPSSCAHVLMESALHYFNDPRLITEASITKTQAGLAEGWGCSEPCLTTMETGYWPDCSIQNSLGHRWAGHFCKS